MEGMHVNGVYTLVPDNVDIWVRPPEGYGAPGMVAKLHKSVGAYVDDLLITGDDTNGINQVKAELSKRFRISDRDLQTKQVHSRHLEEVCTGTHRCRW